MTQDEKILLKAKRNANQLTKAYQNKQPHSNGRLQIVPKLLLALDVFAVAQYLYFKHLPLKNMGNVKSQTNHFLTMHCFLYHKHALTLNYRKTVYNLDHLINGLYPEVPIKFIVPQPKRLETKDYHSKSYKKLLSAVLKLQKHQGNTGKLALICLNNLQNLAKVNKKKLLSIVFQINVKHLKNVAKQYAKSNLHVSPQSKKYSSTVKHLYDKNIIHYINFHSQQAYKIILKIMCNTDIEIHF